VYAKGQFAYNGIKYAISIIKTGVDMMDDKGIK
jgi:hypothetical protein